jgi:uncharacterized protein YecT (DUF1311 family)
MKMKLTAIGLCILCCALGAKAQTTKQEVIDADYRKCLQKDTAYVNVCNCAFVAFGKWSKEMTRTYDRLLRETKKEQQREALKKSQQAWMAYKDAEFDTYNHIFNYGGSKWCTVRQDKRIDIVRARALQLHNYLDSLKRR